MPLFFSHVKNERHPYGRFSRPKRVIPASGIGQFFGLCALSLTNNSEQCECLTSLKIYTSCINKETIIFASMEYKNSERIRN